MTTIKRKQLVLNIEDENQIIKAWLTLVSGIGRFTPREIDVLEVLLLKRQELTTNQVKGKYLSELLFSTSARKEYIQTLEISDFNFTNILSSIKKKGAIIQVFEYEDLDPNLIPADEITIKFVINDERSEDTGEDS